MTYFIPSFLQKRVLRYALSRLELLDTDALNLENLAIAWGRQSTIELRDIPVHTKVREAHRRRFLGSTNWIKRFQKLSALLQLPSSVAVLSAQILFLRLTVPSDLYQSGISVDIEGVEIRLSADVEKHPDNETTGLRSCRTQHGQDMAGYKTDALRNTQSHVHDPGGVYKPYSSHENFSDDEEFSEHLPTTDDLAKSFLQSEPREYKAELKAAIAQSQQLEQSQVSGEDGDEPSSLGVGNTISLPGFLSDFLKGVVDRIQLKVQNVTLDLDLKVDLNSEGSARSDGLDKLDAVTMRLSIEDIALDGVTSVINTKPQDSDLKDLGLDMHCVRRLSISNITALLISESSVFSNLARSTAPASPNATHASTIEKSVSRPSKPPFSKTETSSSTSAFAVRSQKAEDHKFKVPMANELFKSSGDTMSNEGDAPLITSAHGYASERAQDDDIVLTDLYYSDSGPPHYTQGILENSDGPQRSSLYVHGADCDPSSSGTRRLRRSSPIVEFHATEASRLNRSPERSYTEVLNDPHVDDKLGNQSDHLRLSGVIAHSHVGSPQDLASHDSSPSEDLTKSKIFSHEEAESMYMSAISHASTTRKDRSTTIPGNWGSSDSESEDEERIASFFEKPSIPTHRDTSSIDGYQQSIGLSPERDLERTGTQHYGSVGSSGVHESSTFMLDDQPEPGSSTKLERRKERPPSGSLLSSTNLKGSFTMKKQIMIVDSIVLELPQHLSPLTNDPLVNPSPTHVTSNDNPHINFSDLPSTSSKLRNPHDFQHSGTPLTIVIGNIQVLSDMGLTKMMILVAQQINTMRKNIPPKSTKNQVSRPAPSKRNHLRLNIQKANWRFFDVVKGTSVSSTDQHDAVAAAFPHQPEILLRAEIDDCLAVSYDPTSPLMFQFTLGNFYFGYASGNILSFDSGSKMRESTRDILAPVDADLALTIEKTNNSTKIHVTTLPLRIALDLRRLDETFGWFGGFSSMLDLGSSVMSTVTVKTPGSKGSRPLKSPRGVHFETPGSSKLGQPRASEVQNKVSARIGGLVFDLRGSQASLRLESTALKLVSRLEGLGVVVDRLNVGGPYMQQSDSEPSVQMKLVNLRLEYLSTPKEADLDRLLALLSPSKDKYDHDDDILVDTLLRQRRQGGVIRAKVDSLEGYVSSVAALHCFPALSEDLKKLSTVTKYLPEDDRPGILTLASIRDFKSETTIDGDIGLASIAFQDIDFAHVTFPSLMALGIRAVSLRRNHIEELVGEALHEDTDDISHVPMLMARFVGNEMEPTAKIKLNNLRVEYRVSTVTAMMGYKEFIEDGSLLADMVSSVATLTSRERAPRQPVQHSTQAAARSDIPASSMALRLDVVLRDSVLGLNPRNYPAKGLVVLTNTHFSGVVPREDEAHAVLEIKKASIMVIDNVANVVAAKTTPKRPSYDGRRGQVEALSATGFVTLSTISAAKATIEVVGGSDNSSKSIDIEIKDKLFVLESCADSSQTLQTIINGLNPPVRPSKELRYRTEIVPVEDLLASFVGNAFAAEEANEGDKDDFPLELDEGDMVDDEVPQNLEFVSSFYNPVPEAASEGVADSMLEDPLESLASPPVIQEIGSRNLLKSFQEQAQVAPGNQPLDFEDEHFGSTSNVEGTADRGNTRENPYGLIDHSKLRTSPFRLRVRDVHIIWNLFDGYDWQHTRDVITNAVEEVQNRATERMSRKEKRKSLDVEDEEESVIGDFLFNSIYIGIPASRDPNELARQVSHNLDELSSEPGSYGASSTSGSPSRQAQISRLNSGKLRLKRSKHHKITFELKGISADVVVFPPASGETQSSIDVRVQDLEIFDHVPTSTWKKFATYMHDAGERESGTSMVHVEILNVKPVPNLAASEIILKVCLIDARSCQY